MGGPGASGDDLSQARAFLRDVVPNTPRLWVGRVPGVAGAVVTHVEDGWVDLSFHGRDVAEAQAVADALLHPDALPTDDFVFRLTDEDGIHFQGFGWDGGPPAGALAPPDRPRFPALSMTLDLPRS